MVLARRERRGNRHSVTAQRFDFQQISKNGHSTQCVDVDIDVVVILQQDKPANTYPLLLYTQASCYHYQ
jgi:hypothetical protein